MSRAVRDVGSRNALKVKNESGQARRTGNWRLGTGPRPATTYLRGRPEPGPQVVHRPAHRPDAAPERVPLPGHRLRGRPPQLRVTVPRRPGAPGRPPVQRVRALLVEPVAELSLRVRLGEALGQRAGVAALAAQKVQLAAHHDGVPSAEIIHRAFTTCRGDGIVKFGKKKKK